MESSSEYTVSDYVAAFQRRRGILLTVALPIIALASLFSMFLADKYTAYTQIDINLEGVNARTLEAIEVTSYADQYISKLTDRALTRENLLELVNKADVIAASPEGSTEAERLEMASNSIDVSVVTQLVTSPTTGREVDLISGFLVLSEGAEPEFVYQVARHTSQLFLEADRVSRTERASSASTFLTEQMENTETSIVALEKEIAEFKVDNACCLPELVNLNTSVIERAERELADVRPRLRALEQDRAFLLSQLKEIRQHTAADDRVAELERQYMSLVANYGPDHPDVTKLRREIIAIIGADTEGAYETLDLRMKLIEAEQRYSSEHPDVVRYKRQIAALEAKGAGSSAERARLLENPRYNQARTSLNAVETELAELRTSEPELRAKIDEYEERLMRTPQVESEYQGILRRLESARENFDDLQRRAIVARQSAALESTEFGARLVEITAASIPRYPSGPPRTAILIVGAFLAATLGVGAMLFAEMTDSTVRGSKDVMRVMNTVPLATIPVIDNAASRSERGRKLLLIRGALVLVTLIVIASYLGRLF